MLLRVGPNTDSAELIDRARLIWNELTNTLPEKPYVFSKVEFDWIYPDASGVAACVANLGPRYENSECCQLALSDRFFELPSKEQHLTLLHEWIHLRFFCGELRQRTIDTIDMAKRFNRQMPADEFYRACVASSLWRFLDEVVAEHYLQQRHKSVAVSRAEYYQRMRLRTKIPDEYVGESRGFAAFYEVLRCSLGVDILRRCAQDAGVLEGLVERFDREFINSNIPDGTKDALQALRPKLLEVTFDPLTFDADAYQLVHDIALGA